MIEGRFRKEAPLFLGLDAPPLFRSSRPTPGSSESAGLEAIHPASCLEAKALDPGVRRDARVLSISLML
jgi:hypothetical protein